MTAISDYEPADLVLTAQAGVSLAAIAAATHRHKQFLALDPPVADAATIGGVVASAAAGPLRLAHGTPRDHVLGMAIVAGDGRVLHFGGKVVKNVAGYDVVRPLVGSHGSLALLTEVSVRLKPLPEADQTAFLENDTFDAAAETAAAIVAARLDVVALEIVSPALAKDFGAQGWSVVVRMHGNSAAVADSISILEQIGRTRAADERVWAVLRSQEQEPAWLFRFADLPGRLQRTGGRALRFAESALGTDARMLAHAGDGIVRLLSDQLSDDFDELLHETRAALVADGGTLLIERSARPVSMAPVDPAVAALMAGVKRVFDPAGILISDYFA